MTIKLGSLFDGIGVFPLAAARCGITPVWASEIEKAPISITKRHFPDMAHLGDITRMDGGAIPPVHVLTFGSPCQNLSQIGNRDGLAGAKSSLFFQAIRIIKEMRDATDNLFPVIAVWENVMGAFSSNDRMDFRAVLSAFNAADVPMPASGRCLYFLLRPRFGTETLSWVCILGAFPFAAMGFIKYNGMTAEQFVWAWIKSEFLMPKKLMFLPDNLYYETMKPTIEAHEKGLPTVRKKQKGRTPKPKKTKKKKAKRSKEVNNAENS